MKKILLTLIVLTTFSSRVHGEIAASTITAAKIAAGAITADKIAANTITAAQIATGAITADEISAGAIEAAHIQAGSITADRLGITTLSAITANLGSVTAGQIVVGGGDKLWLNDGGDGSLNVGGSSKGSAPFKLAANGNLTAESIGYFNLYGSYLDVQQTITMSNWTNGNGAFVCVNSAHNFYASATTCDGSTPVNDRIAALEKEVARLQAALAGGSR